jgi:spermidine synthase
MLFDKMHKYIPEGKKGIAEIKHVDLQAPTRRMLTHPQEYVAPGIYTHLLLHGSLMMADTDMEYVTNRHVIHQAEGDVLVGGLGIGYMILPLLLKDSVESVTVVELHQDVIDLVEPHLRAAKETYYTDKLTVICDDIRTYKPAKRRQWDTIYFDIWQAITADNLPEMTHLHRRFGQHKRAKGWMGSWEHARLLRERKRRASAYFPKGGW